MVSWLSLQRALCRKEILFTLCYHPQGLGKMIAGLNENLQTVQ